MTECRHPEGGDKPVKKAKKPSKKKRIKALEERLDAFGRQCNGHGHNIAALNKGEGNGFVVAAKDRAALTKRISVLEANQKTENWWDRNVSGPGLSFFLFIGFWSLIGAAWAAAGIWHHLLQGNIGP